MALDDSLSDADPLDAVLAACLNRPISEQRAALEEACSAAPGDAEELRRRFDVLSALGLDTLFEEEFDAEAPAESRRFGDFELGEVLGVGGMGVVHRARQVSLDREVVVKLIRPEQLHFESARERFRREAEAVAKLGHPGIVPVHLVGEHDGVPFFVMESIEGVSLADLLDDVAGRAPEGLVGRELAPGLEGGWVAACVHVARQVAEALEHARSRGILHRDVKPSNVLVSADGRARLVDFGLHALLDGDSGADRLTRHGSTPGTLLYMAPEQLERGEYDARSEVYALGATLYELLTLQPPFRGEDRSSTERAIRRGGVDPLRPRNRRVPADLEAVVLKALALQPSRRYASARELALDLGRVEEGRPVEARPDGAIYRAWRWATRQPALAAASLLAFLLAVGLPLAVIWQQRAHNAELRGALADEREARAESEDLTQLLLELFDTGDPAQGEPSSAVTSVLERGVERLDDLLADRPYRRALMQSVLGRVHGNLGLRIEGLELLNRAIETLEELHEEEAAGRSAGELRQLNLDLAEARARSANLLESFGLQGKILALPVREALVEDLRSVHGESHWEVVVAQANALRLAGQIPEADLGGRARPSSSEVLDALRGAVEAIADAQDISGRHAAAVHGWLGSQLTNHALGRPGDTSRMDWLTEGEEELRTSLRLLEAERRADSLDWVKATGTLGVNLKLQGRLEEAEPHYLTVIEAMTRRLGEGSEERATALLNYGQLLEARGERERAVECMEEALTILRGTRSANDPALVITEGNLMGTLMRLGRLEGLAARYEALIPLQEGVFGPDHPVLRASHEFHGRALESEGRAAEARAAYERALELWRAAGEGDSASARSLEERLAPLVR